MDCINVLTKDGKKIQIQISPLGIDGLLETESSLTILPSFWNKRKRDNADLPYPLLFSNEKNDPYVFSLLPECRTGCDVFTVVKKIVIPLDSTDRDSSNRDSRIDKVAGKVRLSQKNVLHNLSFLGKTIPLEQR